MENAMSARYPFALIKERLAARDGATADFAIGGGQLPLPEQLRDWIREHALLATQAATRDEMTAFKEAAARLLRRQYGVRDDGVGILPLAGARMAMSAIVTCLLEPGDDVLATEPGYPAFARLVAHRGGRVHSARLDPAAEFVPEITGFGARQRKNGFKLVYLNYPNNPTGAVWSAPARQRILAVAGRPGTIVVNDAVYGPLSFAREPHSLLAEDFSGPHGLSVLELHALTKLYPLGPLSVSLLAGPASVIDALETYTEFASSPLSALQIRATTWALDDELGQAQRREFVERRLTALRSVLTETGFAPYAAHGGLYVLCATPARIAGRRVESATEAAARLLDEFDLAVVPWSIGPDSYLRFSALYRDEALPRLAALSGRLGLKRT
jgi:aspartate/methionine/tyrosine aminotransferase